MTAVYDKDGVHFLYPENWQLTESPASDSPREINVDSPNGGFWSLHLYSTPTDPPALLDEVVSALRKDYTGLDSELVTEQIGQYHAVGYDVDFYCLDLVITACVRCVRTGSLTYRLLYQAESRDFEELAPVFRAITLSLLQ